MIGNLKINLSTLLIWSLNIFKSIPYILVLVLLILIQRQCSTGPTSIEPVTITKIQTKWDTVKVNTLVYVPRWKTRVVTIHDTIPSETDTLEVLKDYFSKIEYRDTIKIDTFGYITVTDTISKNRILSRKLTSEIRVPVTTVQTNTITNKTRLYTGINLSGSREAINQAGIGLMLKTKESRVYGIGVGVNRELKPLISGSIYWEIQFKKPKLKLF